MLESAIQSQEFCEHEKKYEHVKSLGGVHVEVEIVGKTGKIK